MLCMLHLDKLCHTLDTCRPQEVTFRTTVLYPGKLHATVQLCVWYWVILCHAL